MKSGGLDLGSLRAAVASLEGALSVVDDKEWLAAQSDKVRDTLGAGVVQNFEFVYEVAVKILRRRLVLDAATPADVVALNFRDLLRHAGDAGLVDEIEAWFQFREMRNLTAHAYDRAKAAMIQAAAPSLARHARALLERLEANNG
ncbi:MAG TPA: HI0074 family nucleotidyltransferase substrate-binding subunit [Caulobacteraceae bacterium]|nr:HI0074 family nucleotidyltransferase substrate-binding subunit [Caulobacteraceae bacterium]